MPHFLPISRLQQSRFDGGDVRARHRRPERNFGIVAGKVLAEGGSATRFAFGRQGSSAGVSTAHHALRRHGVSDTTRLTVLTDGDAGLRAIRSSARTYRRSTFSDWFHVSMRFRTSSRSREAFTASQMDRFVATRSISWGERNGVSGIAR